MVKCITNYMIERTVLMLEAFNVHFKKSYSDLSGQF